MSSSSLVPLVAGRLHLRPRCCRASRRRSSCAPFTPHRRPSIELYGKRYDLLTLENPYREVREGGSRRSSARSSLKAARSTSSNCQYCHGDKLDGQGPYAQGLNPTPLNFQDIGTIAQLQESYPVLAHRHRRARAARRGRAVDFFDAGLAELPDRGRDLEGHPVPLRLYRPPAAVVGRRMSAVGRWCARVFR